MQDPFPSSTPPLVEIRRVTRQFGTKTALHDVRTAAENARAQRDFIVFLQDGPEGLHMTMRPRHSARP